MPILLQVIEDEAEYVLVIEEQKRRRPNSPGTSKRQHFQRANQKRRRKDFEWYAPPRVSPQKDSPRHEGRDIEDSRKFTWTAPATEPHVEPPRPAGWKPLVLTPQLVKLSEEGIRKLADERMKDWSKDQEAYTEKQFREIEVKKAALKAQAEIEQQMQEAREKAQAEQRMRDQEARVREIEATALKAQALKAEQDAREKAQAEQQQRDQDAQARREAQRLANESREKRRSLLEAVQIEIPARIAKFKEQLTQEEQDWPMIVEIVKKIEALKAQGLQGRLRILRSLEEELAEAKERFLKWKDLTRQCIQFEEIQLKRYQAELRKSGDLF
jgi:hypothetical protein